MRIQISKWSEFQHYKQRSPPWIKLHRRLLDNRQWHELSGDASKLLAECWLLASDSDDGSIECELDDFAWKRRRETSVVATLLQELVEQGFIKIPPTDASKLLAARMQGARQRERRGEVEERTETEQKEEHPPTPLNGDGDVEKSLRNAIRQRLHLGAERVTVNGKEFGLGYSMAIARKMLKRGTDPGELLLAVEHVRDLGDIPADAPLTMAYLESQPAILNQAIGVGYKRQEAPP